MNMNNVVPSNGDAVNAVQFPTGGDAAKRKLIQQQLVLLLHAQKCYQRDLGGQQLQQCRLPHCQTMKNVWKHIINCNSGFECTAPHCASSKRILSHWKQCKNESCLICSTVRQAKEKSTAAGFSGLNGTSQSNGSFCMNNGRTAAEQGAGTSSVNFNGIGCSASASSAGKEWQKYVVTGFRESLVNRLIQCICPAFDAASEDPRMRAVVSFARHTEEEMFQIANSQDEYHQILAEKLYKIQKELADKKRKRFEQQQLQQQQQMQLQQTTTNYVESNGKFFNVLKNFDSTVPPNRIAPVETNGLWENEYTKLFPKIQNTSKCESEMSACTISKPSVADKFFPKIEKNENEDIPNNFVGDSNGRTMEDLMGGKNYDVGDLRSLLMPVWQKLYDEEDGVWFRTPVDPELLQIPDYFKIVTSPMDLSTIGNKLLKGCYEDAWQFCDDVWLMFDNARLYNRKNSKVYKCCVKLSDMFAQLIDPIMKSAGYCCGRRLSFTPLALLCYGRLCQIPRDSFYYYYETKPQLGLSVERYIYCKKCFEETAGSSICLNDDPNSLESNVPKSEFKFLKNDAIEYEPFVKCRECGRKLHQICAFYFEPLFPGGFVCEQCMKIKNIKRLENRHTAKRLPTCNLSNYLENRVNNYLRDQKCSDGAEIIIRVLTCTEKEVDVKPLMKAKYCTTGEYPEKYPFRTKAIFAFEVIDGVEVCFFCLQVQEYGDKCKFPNNRRVYIAYLDSIHYFQPRELRTSVYHEILLAYLEYCKNLGYATAHIWACPPSEGDDYIFHCHPPEQKIPKPKRLQEWYKRLLNRAVAERIVVDYNDIFKQSQDDNLQCVTQLPYFEGDYWPSVIEDAIKTASDADDEQKCVETEASSTNATEISSIDDAETETEHFPSKNKKKSTKEAKKHKHKTKGNTTSKKSKKSVTSNGNGIVGKLLTSMEKYKEVFFVAQLHPSRSVLNLGPINDPDPVINCEMMESRDIFLSTCREHHWEFSSLRRAKFSTLALCHELHMQGQEKFSYNCDSCQSANVAWHCTVCEDFDLCATCYAKNNHAHNMTPLQQKTSTMSVESTSNGGGGGELEKQTQKIQRAVNWFVHASSCRNANCASAVCDTMKKLISHNKHCDVKVSHLNCPWCKKYWFFCVLHAKMCRELNCYVANCSVIRQRIAASEMAKRNRRDREMFRRITDMDNNQALLDSYSNGV